MRAVMPAESSTRTDSSSSSWSSWLEPVALRSATRHASQLSDESRARMRPWVVAARARFRVARELRDSESQRVALGLLRDAAFYALCALEASGSAEAVLPTTSREAWQHFEALANKSAGAPEELALVREAFCAEGALALDLYETARANDLRLAAELSVAWLLGLVEIRTLPELARARLLRIALAALGLVLIAWGFVAYWLSLSALEPR